MSIPADEKSAGAIRRCILELRGHTHNTRAHRAMDDILDATRALEQELDQLAEALQEELDRQHDDDGSHY